MDYEPITVEERAMIIRDPELQRYAPKEYRTPGLGTDYYDVSRDKMERLFGEHNRRLQKDFDDEAKFYDHVFLNDSILHTDFDITAINGGLKPIPEKQAEFGFVLGGYVNIHTTLQPKPNMYGLKFKRIKLNNFKGLRLPHVDFTTPGYNHGYYAQYNDMLIDAKQRYSIHKDSVLVSLLYQNKKDFDNRPFDFGLAVLFVDERTLFVKYGNKEYEKTLK